MTSLVLRRGDLNSKMSTSDISIPTHFRCPISLELMQDPVTTTTGITYDRQSIETWLDMGNTTCPVTNQPIISNHSEDLIPNHTLRRMIQNWCVAHSSLGVYRIPTPRTPITQHQAVEILSEICYETENSNHLRCGNLVGKMRSLAKESEKNRKCLCYSGARLVLSKAFDAFSRAIPYDGDIRGAGIFEEILSALVLMFPMEKESCSYMGSSESMGYLLWILKFGNLAGRLNAVLTMKELVHAEKNLMTSIVSTIAIDSLVEALVKLIKEPISLPATKAILVSAFFLISSGQKVATRFAEMGMINLVLEMLVDCDKSTCEKCLGVLNVMCMYEVGREMAWDHDLTVAVLVKKLLRVSDLATEFAVSVLWNLCRNNGGDGGGKKRMPLEEMLEVGAFQKLLLLLQIGCGETTKEKATELLKMMNSNRGRLECIETVDFKGLKRPF